MILNLLINKIKNFVREHYSLFLTIMFSLIAIIIYGSISMHDNVWYDEAYQLVLTENKLTDIIKFVALDHHAPFYAITLKIVTLIFGISPFVGRMYSLLAIICCFVLSFTKIKELFGIKTSIIFSLFLISLSGIYYCAIEIRTYSWSMFLTLASSIYLLSYIKNSNKKDLILFIIFSVLGMYSHNMALVYIFCQDIVFFFYLLIRNRKIIKKVFLSYIIQLICYLPWLKILIEQTKHVAEDDFWIEEIGLIEFLNECKELISRNNYIIYIIFGLIIISLIYIVVKRKNIKNSLLLFICFIITFIFLYIISINIMPILVPRYIVTFIGILIFVVSDVLGKIDNKLWLIMLIIFFSINSIYSYKYEYPKINEETLNKNLEFFNQDDDLYFIHYTEFSLGVFRYYFPNAIHFYTDEIKSSLRDYELYGDNVIKLRDIKELNSMNVDTIWVSNLYQVKTARKSRIYFRNWKIIEEHEYVNTYRYGKNYLKKLSKKE